MMFCASVLLASCAAILDDDKTPVHSGEVETSYIAINLMATDPDTRAGEGDSTDGTTEEPTPTYQDGSADERAVKTAYFFFFQNGQPFPVTVKEGAVTAPGTEQGVNYLSATLTPENGIKPDGNVNVSDVKNVVLLLKNYKGEYPNQIIAVLNWVPANGNSYSMDDLEAAVNVQSDRGFVMSNAVFADGAGQAVTATPLTLANIFTTEDQAKASPVNIYVERIAAKVTVAGKDGLIYDIGKTVNDGGTQKAVYAAIDRWELYNEFDKSYLLKQIDPKWTVEGLGFNWNDQAFYRSYWATSPSPTWNAAENAFKWNGGHEISSANYVYCGENTTSEAANRTKVIIKATLIDEGGLSLELARWYGTEYLSENDLLKAVASTLKNTYYYKEIVGETIKYTSIDPTDLQCVVGGTTGAPDGVDATEVYFQLSTAAGKGLAKEWYEYSSDGGYQALEDAALDTNLKAVPSAVLYKGGQTYYFFDIKHLGNTGKTAEYGIVRNHIYIRAHFIFITLL